MANAYIIAKVSVLSGQAFVRDGAGNMRRLKLGDAIREGESVVAGQGATVVLALADGRELNVRPGETVKVDAEVAAVVKPDAADSAVSNAPQSLQKIAQVLKSGGDLDELLEDTAAGAGPQGGNEGHTFVELLRIVEMVDPLAYQFATDRGGVQENAVGAPVGIDTAPPVASITLDANITGDDIINAAEAGQSIAITGTVGGDVQVGDTVTLTINGVEYSGQVLAGNTFSIAVQGADLAADADRVIDARVTTTDAAGNSTTASDTEGYGVDTGAPSVIVNIVDGSLNVGDKVSTVTFSFSEAPVGFTLTDINAVGGTVSNLVATADPKVFTATFTAADNFSGTGSVTVTAGSYSNAAGNPGTAGTDDVGIDTAPPVASITLDANITGDDIINAAEAGQSIAITGTVGGDVQVGDTVTLTINGVEYSGQVLAGNTFSIAVQGADLAADADRVIDARVTTTDAAGNSTTASDTEGYGVDAATGTITLNEISGDVITAVERGQSLAISGTTTGIENNQVVTVSFNGKNYTGTVLGGVFSVTVPAADVALLTDTTTYTATANVADAAGNPAVADTEDVHTLATSISSVSSASAIEASAIVHTLTLTNASPSATTFSLTLTDVTATGGGVDYTSNRSNLTFSNGVTYDSATGQITVPAGISSFTVTVPTTADTIYEANETYTLNVGGVSATGTITNDDAVPTVSTVTNAAATEGTGVVHTVTLSNGSSSATTLTLGLTNGTATGGGVDYTSNPSSLLFSNGVTYSTATGLITIPAGVTSFTVTVPTTADRIDESNETYSLSVGGKSATGTINDNDSSPVAVVDTNAINEDVGSATGNVLTNDSDVDGDALSVSQFTFGGTTYAAGTSVTLSGVGTLVVNSNGSYVFTPATHYSGTPSIAYTLSDGVNTSSANLNITVTAVQDAPLLVIGTTTVVGGSSTTNPLPASTGLRLAFYDALETVLTDAAAANTLNLESAMEGRAATSTTTVSSVGVAESAFGTGDGYRYTGYIYMEAGHTYTFSGYRDDTIQMKIGGTTVLSSGFNNWTTYSESFSPLVSGYYSYELNVFNGDSIGELTTYVAVDGGTALALNSTNFYLYASSADLTSSGTVLGSFVSNDDGGYYPVQIIGADNTWIALGSISASLVDADGSEALLVSVSGIPVGASLTDGTNTFTATSGSTSVNVTGWNLNALQFKAISGYSGVVDLTVTATATEGANGASASSAGTLSVTVADASAPTLYVPQTMIVVSQDTTATYRTVSLPINAALADSAETLSIQVSGLPTGAVLSDGTNSFTASMADSTVNVSSWNLSNLTIMLATNYASTGTAITVTATSTVYAVVDGVNTALDSASTSQDIVLISDYTTSTSASGADDYLAGNNNANTLSGGNGNDLILGNGGDDSLSGGSGSDVIYGGSGSDTIAGGTGSDRIIGGQGSDIMSGNDGATADTTTDVFQWVLNDQGSVLTPAVDMINNFGAAAAARVL